METGLKRVIPDAKTGRLLIQSNIRNGEPELHFLKLPDDISTHDSVLLLDPQMSSGGGMFDFNTKTSHFEDTYY